MVPFERALVSSYKLSIHTGIISASAIDCPKFYIAVLSGGCEPPILGKGPGCRGLGMVPLERALVSFYRPSILHSKFSSIFTRFRDIAAFVLQHATFSLPHL